MPHANLPFHPTATRVVTMSSGTNVADSAGVANGGTIVRLAATVACWVNINAAATSTGSGLYLPANLPELFRVVNGGTINANGTAAGTLSVAEMSR